MRNSLLAYLATSLLVFVVVVEVEVEVEVEVGVGVEVGVVYVVDATTLWIALVSWVYFTIYIVSKYNGSTVLEDVTYKQNSLSGGVTCVRVCACVFKRQNFPH